MNDYFHLTLSPREVNAVSALGLAHIGDGVFELMVRAYLCCEGHSRAGELHRLTVSYVSAPSQARFCAALLPLLDEQEQAFYRRGYNTHPHMIPKNASKHEYACATGLEALFGALYLLGETDRLNELFSRLMEARHAV